MALKTKLLLATTMLGGLAAFAPTVTLAQTAPEPAAQEATAVEEVVVTGSRIRRDPTNSPTPLIQVTRDDVVSTGKASVIDVLADIPALSGSIVPEDTTGSGLNDGGLSLLNLRDLGANRTLTLVDGRRHVGSSSGSLSVDVDTIPRLLIQNVEIVTGANSAQYGADAVSGVVNFILRRDFSGVELDGTVAQINKDGQTNKRFSALVGHNFFDGKLNVYGSYEREQNQEVRDYHMKWRKDAYTLLTVDHDLAGALDDGIYDQILVRDARNISRSSSGLLTLVSDIRPDASRNIPFQACVAGTTGSINANCIIPDPGRSYVFDSANGQARLADFGTFRSTIGRLRNVVVGGDGVNINTEFSQASRLPRSKNDRFQGGLNFNLTDDLQLFAEGKFVKEETFDESQQTFFDIGIVNLPSNANGLLIGTSAFNIGLDNAYLSSNVKNAILSNVRPIFNSAGVQTGSVLDQRARFSNWGPARSQLNKKELQRYVLGARGSKDELGFIQNLSYELSYTYGQLENTNNERAVDVLRYKHSVDAVIDTAGVVNGKPGEAVCRVQLLAAQGIAVPDQFRGGNYTKGTAAYNEISQCVASQLFGGIYSQAARNFFDASITVQDKNQQQDALGFVSGELWDFWGAGRIGLALGVEWRKEETQSIGRSTSTGDRMLFLNTGPDFPKVNYETREVFGEVNLPLLSDVFLAKKLEIGGAYRRSDYTTVGTVDTYNLNLVWRPIEDIMFRATSGKAVRVPNLGENFRPPTQTFASITDPCSDTVIQAVTDTKIKANRVKNCQALGIPTGTVITYTSTPAGKNAGNPFLKPEKSFSYSASMVITPRFWPNTTFVFDYYNIDIKDVIASVTAQTAANQCVNGDTLNTAICSTLTRIGATAQGTTPAYGIIDFIQGSVNYARTMNRGLDFQFLWRGDLETITGWDMGRLNYRMSGTYLFEQHDFTNIADPNQHTDYETTVGLPRVRFSSTLDWQVNDKLSLQWSADWQSSQEIIDPDNIGANKDIYDPKYFTTGSFIQHDFTVRYAPKDDFTLRAGVVNAFDKNPALWLGNTSADNFDFFGRRFFVGFNYKM
ncbi:MAG: TonB-dependent receptor [Caulobacter vibrioides]|uniref:TonB-dependent receptor n=1 Tax=Caulobacter vibrioides TaxID=155892 RepID=A0A258D398_CAUVI|nr:MAG: TonB-dependent receptor [Caulobacter vibrioides]